MNKPEAIRFVNSKINDDVVLNNKNTHFSDVNANSKEVWWLNIPPEKFNHILYILLKDKSTLVWLEIPANSIPNPKQHFRYREDNHTIDLEISCKKSNYLQDIKSRGTGYDFTRYIKDKFGI